MSKEEEKIVLSIDNCVAFLIGQFYMIYRQTVILPKVPMEFEEWAIEKRLFKQPAEGGT